jgi:hypothetical protein
VERQWEGTSIGPDLAAAPGADREEPASRAVLAFGADDDRSASLLAYLGGVVWVAEGPGRAGPDDASPVATGAAGSVVFAPDIAAPDAAAPDAAALGAGRAGDPGEAGTQRALALPDPGAACSAVADLLGRVRSAIELTAHHDDRGTVIVFPGGLPWLDDEADLARWVAWYAAVGLVRGGAATEGIYGVRVNGLVLGPGHERLGGALVRYLLSPASSWLNGYVLTIDGRGVGLLSDENPRWQGYASGDDFTLPDGLLANLSDYRV